MSRRDFLEILDAGAARGFILKVLTKRHADQRGGRAKVREGRRHRGVGERVRRDRRGARRRHADPRIVRSHVARYRLLREQGIHVVLKTPMLTRNGDAAKDVHRKAMMMNMPCSFEMSISPKNDGDPGPMALMLAKQTMIDLLAASPFREQLSAPPALDGPAPARAARAARIAPSVPPVT